MDLDFTPSGNGVPDNNSYNGRKAESPIKIVNSQNELGRPTTAKNSIASP